MRFLSRFVGTAAAIALAGCGVTYTSAPAAGAAATVRVFNDSPYILTNIHVTTADNVEFVEASLAPGTLSVAHSVAELHESPAVTVVAAGATLGVMPTEGFTGFNPPVGGGAYVLSINVSGTPAQLRISLTRPVEDRVGTP